MRPIFFEEDNVKLMTNAATYLWGKDLLITPILKDSVKTKAIYFPKTANWFNFYSDEKIEGGQTKKVTVLANSIPTYVKAGAFIPMTKLVQTTDDYNGNNLEIHYYFDSSVKKSERKMFNDNGLLSNAFEKGEYELLEFKAALTKKCLEINFEAELGAHWNPSEKEITLILHNIDWNPTKIKIDGKRTQILSENNRLTLPFKWNTTKGLRLKITLK
jgi:oligosaccharide 4-alpha-D-glucosyltransferase